MPYYLLYSRSGGNGETGAVANKGLLPRNQPKNRSGMSIKVMMRKMSQSTTLPPINHNIEYSKQECFVLALSHYHGEFADPKIIKPNVLQITKIYGIVEPTLRRHIKTSGLKTQKEAFSNMQVLTTEEENVLAERLLFLHDFNVLASKATF